MLKFQLRFSQNRVFADRPLEFSTAQNRTSRFDKYCCESKFSTLTITLTPP